MGGESSYAVLFPGQGSQAVGMAGELARAFPQARQALELAEQAVPGLVELMQKGPEDELRRTSNAQPALLAAGLACWWVWQGLCRRPPAAMAGHSLGEYTALAAAQALTAEDALRAVRLRGELMEQAMEPGKGGMAAVMGLQDEDVVQLCQQACQNLGEPAAVVAANFNAPGQVVVSGTSQGLQEVQSLVRARGGRFIALAVSGPFHSPWMAAAAQRFARALEEIPVGVPRVPVWANVTAKPYPPDGQAIRELLCRQLTAPVRWAQTVRELGAAGIRVFVELGPGKVLSGLVRRTLGDEVVAVSAGDPGSLEQALAAVEGAAP